eukprot:TRINITY_DN3527_c0_g1_i3.p1 TRINITY_DN3527_c0_g1~~TRINITY_DN3527_c0_g1_i3.p1  ORF type:complete len:297 (+),score=49.69 TRINITY_DN3527_c0_g1_i3:191-1081(+)
MPTRPEVTVRPDFLLPNPYGWNDYEAYMHPYMPYYMAYSPHQFAQDPSLEQRLGSFYDPTSQPLGYDIHSHKKLSDIGNFGTEKYSGSDNPNSKPSTPSDPQSHTIPHHAQPPPHYHQGIPSIPSYLSSSYGYSHYQPFPAPPPPTASYSTSTSYPIPAQYPRTFLYKNTFGSGVVQGSPTGHYINASPDDDYVTSKNVPHSMPSFFPNMGVDPSNQREGPSNPRTSVVSTSQSGVKQGENSQGQVNFGATQPDTVDYRGEHLVTNFSFGSISNNGVPIVSSLPFLIPPPYQTSRN